MNIMIRCVLSEFHRWRNKHHLGELKSLFTHTSCNVVVSSVTDSIFAGTYFRTYAQVPLWAASCSHFPINVKCSIMQPCPMRVFRSSPITSVDMENGYRRVKLPALFGLLLSKACSTFLCALSRWWTTLGVYLRLSLKKNHRLWRTFWHCIHLWYRIIWTLLARPLTVHRRPFNHKSPCSAHIPCVLAI